MAESLTINGKNVAHSRTSLPLSSLELDPANPRIQFLMGQRGTSVSQAELYTILWEKDAVKALANSILQNGGVYESIIVQRDGKKFRVREGNCRVAASRHLSEQRPNDTRFKTIPALVFDAELSEEDLAILLADMHVAGKIRWDAYEQAKHVHDLHTLYGKTYEWLSNHLRLSKSKIIELLSAYGATSEFLAAHPAPGNVRKFSLFHELMRKKDLRQSFDEEPQFKHKFHKWLLDDRLTDSKQVRGLPA